MFLNLRYLSHSRKANESSVKIFSYLFIIASSSFSLHLAYKISFFVSKNTTDMHKGIRLILEVLFWKPKNNYCIFPFVTAAVSGVLFLAHNMTDQIFWKYILKKLNECTFYCIIFLKELKVLFYLKRFLAAFPWYTMTHLALCVSN